MISQPRSEDRIAEVTTGALLLPCPWCGTPVERKVRGVHPKKFCDKDCKNVFNNELARFLKLLVRCANEPGLLKRVRDQISSVV